MNMKYILYFFCLILISVQNVASEITHGFDSSVETTNSIQIKIEKSQPDTSKYRYIMLPNKMKVLLISDVKADKAAVSLDVFAGSSHDPVTRQGLAHFLEHMLFLGTDKYPEPNEYQSFISKNGGSHNAYTSFEHTNYFFDINPKSIEPALDRFSRFFIAPLFNSEYVNREMNVVHSEYMARIKNDYRRQRDALSEIVNPSHPVSKFSVGNLDILSNERIGNVKADLLKFHDEHYSANKMALVVLAPNSLDELESIVTAKFNEVKNSNRSISEHKEPLFTKGRLPLLLSIKPVQENHQLTVTFPLPSMKDYYREKPLNYISSLIGDEGEGSLLSFLKDKGWAEALMAGEGLSDQSGSSFNVTIRLTPAGISQWEKIVDLVFQKIELISKNGIEKWRWIEQKNLADIAFRFKETVSPSARVMQLSSQLHDYPSHLVIRGPYLYDRFNPELIYKLLDFLKPNNSLVTLVSPEIKANKVSKLYKTPYKLKKIKTLKRFRSEADLKLPLPNKFIPDSFEIKSKLKELTVDTPKLLVDNENFRLWHHLDSLYQVPKAQFYASFRIPLLKDANDASMLDLYLRIVNEKLKESNYAATLAGLNYGLFRKADKVIIFISGFDSKLAFLAKEITAEFFSPLFNQRDKTVPENNINLEDELFYRLRSELTREWQNIKKDSPYKQVASEVSYKIDTRSWSPQELAEAISSFDKNEFNGLIRTLFSDLTADFLIAGNINASEAKSIVKPMMSLFNDKPLEVGRQIYKVTAGEMLNSSLEINHNDLAILRYYQGRNDTALEEASIILLRQLISSDFFHELRTEKQLGYIVATVNQKVDRVPGIGLLVQSPDASLVRLGEEIDNFLLNFLDKLKAMTKEDFDKQRKAVLFKLQEKPKNLSEHLSRYWESIITLNYSFDRREKLIAAIQKISHQDILDIFYPLMIKSGYSFQIDSGNIFSFDKKQFEENREIFTFSTEDR